MYNNIKDKVIIITGASSGIGEALAKSWANREEKAGSGSSQGLTAWKNWLRKSVKTAEQPYIK